MMGFGGNGIPERGPGNRGVNPGYSQGGEEREQGPLPRRWSREIWGGFPAKWQADYRGVFASQARQSAVVTQ